MARKQKKLAGRPLRILEIGALMGESAAILSRHGKVLTVDTWENPEMKKEFLRRTANKNVEYVQGNSMDVLPKLESSYDFIYVDGSHHYTETMSDIENSKRLVDNGGIIVGDDFDLSINEVDRQALGRVRETDVARDPKTGKLCHPGVTLAIAGQFGDWVKKVPHTFWAVRKIDDKFVNAL